MLPVFFLFRKNLLHHWVQCCSPISLLSGLVCMVLYWCGFCAEWQYGYVCDFIGYFMYLHFKCYPLSWFPLWIPPFHPLFPLLLWGYSTSHPSTPNLPPWHAPTLGNWAFTGPRASPIDARQCHPLLHMWLEPWVSPCVLCGWWFSPWELWGGRRDLVGWYCCSS